jgi:hypothetical protein
MSNIICFGCRQPKYQTVCCRYSAVIPFHDWTDGLPFLSRISKPKFSFKDLEAYLDTVTFDLPPRYTKEPK